ncbi:hypothetical protein HOY82DRAFT_480860 [Tuber indicum]|nr:hypothetical protein HOY82DRAFT_480860 [Tuber indicum]
MHAASTSQGIKPVPRSRSPGTQKPTDIGASLNDSSEEFRTVGSPMSFLPDRTHENESPQAGPPDPTAVASGDPSTSRHDSGYGESLPGLNSEENWFFDYEIFDKSTDWLRGWGDWPAAPQKEGQADSCSLLDLKHSATTSGAVPSFAITAGVGSSKRVASPVSVCSDEGSMFKIKHRDDYQTRLPAVRPIKDHTSVEDFLPWSWQSSREKLERRVTLPPLRQILEELTPQTLAVTRAHSPANANKDESWIDDRILNDMVSLLSIPVERFPYESADMSKFPSKSMIDSFIKIYFEKFHAILPMIHKPTFSAGTCPTIVLIAMASIGASYSHLEGAKMFADSLSELCRRTLAWMAEYNPEYPRSDFFLMASCLQSVYALGSGSHRLYDCADVSRSALIGSARQIGLFSGRVSPPSSSPGSTRGSPNPRTTRDEDSHSEEEIEVRWRRWYVKEKLRRLAWSIFEYDCSFSTLSNRRGAINLNDISTRMPCAEALWQAPTAQAWGAILESGVLPPGAEKGTPFYPTLRDVISGKMSPENLTSWGRRLCAQAIGRILWDFKELEESVLSESSSVGNDGGLGLPMLSPGLKPAKEKLLKSLMVICEGVRERQMDAGWKDGEVDGDRAHMALALLISHYTHLHAAFPTVSLILSLARRPPPSTTTPADPRIVRLKAIFEADPVYGRTLAWNAAQIIAISRWKPVCSPVEGMRIFMAGVVLWGFGRYFQEPLPPSPPHSGPFGGVQEEVVRLDSQPWKGVDDWIKKGKGKATIGSDQHAGNAMTEICSEMGAREVLRVVVGILGRMRVWGLGGEFKNVLEEMVRRS